MSNIATTIEQSKELVRLGLDPKTADMNWFGNEEFGVEYTLELLPYEKRSVYHHCLPAWSLTALLEVMPNETRLLKAADNGTYLCDMGFSTGKWYDNPIDAVFAMMVYLLEQGLIKKGGQDGN